MEAVNFKLYPETAALYKKLKEESDMGKTHDSFLRFLLENVINPRAVSGRTPEDEALIQQLTDNISELQSEVSSLRELNGQLNTQITQEGIIPPGKILFEVSENEAREIQTLKEYVMMRKNMELTDAEALYLMIRDRKISR